MEDEINFTMPQIKNSLKTNTKLYVLDRKNIKLVKVDVIFQF